MDTYTIKNPSDIFSLIMNVYGTLEKSIKFISDNIVLIPSINTNVSSMAGKEVYFEPALVVTYLSPSPVLSTQVTPGTEYSWRGREGPNFFDVCIQTYGGLEKQIKLMSENEIDFSSTVYLQEFAYDSTQIANSTVWNRSTGMGIVFSTGGNQQGAGSSDGSFESSSFDDSFEGA